MRSDKERSTPFRSDGNYALFPSLLVLIQKPRTVCKRQASLPSPTVLMCFDDCDQLVTMLDTTVLWLQKTIVIKLSNELLDLVANLLCQTDLAKLCLICKRFDEAGRETTLKSARGKLLYIHPKSIARALDICADHKYARSITTVSIIGTPSVRSGARRSPFRHLINNMWPRSADNPDPPGLKIAALCALENATFHDTYNTLCQCLASLPALDALRYGVADVPGLNMTSGMAASAHATACRNFEAQFPNASHAEHTTHWSDLEVFYGLIIAAPNIAKLHVTSSFGEYMMPRDRLVLEMREKRHYRHITSISSETISIAEVSYSLIQQCTNVKVLNLRTIRREDEGPQTPSVRDQLSLGIELPSLESLRIACTSEAPLVMYHGRMCQQLRRHRGTLRVVHFENIAFHGSIIASADDAQLGALGLEPIREILRSECQKLTSVRIRLRAGGDLEGEESIDGAVAIAIGRLALQLGLHKSDGWWNIAEDLLMGDL